ncbi:ionotropic receptor 93a-like isoform X1 [Daphnia pulicaria]|uniref:ionotropic receptor 93a-like isoform X1 n=2 Tax=Daphnia pulicaria TaxID=35523 RepID=UPI001EEA1C73|nr:ionotropic receptor 93a-like isoform X1 [Daphnia pulicaria]XP_046649956.1 ionotropic receptor 93a-like isoform X1 [Daphnia pulicaria]
MMGYIILILLSLIPLLLRSVPIKFHVTGSPLLEERQLLHGRQLRASAFNFMPCLSATKMSSGNYSYFGICNDIIKWVSEHFQMELIYVPVDNTDRVKLGIVPALIKQIVKQEVDVIPFSFVPTPGLLLQIDCSIPLTVEDYYLLQPWPKEESRLTACIRPFSLNVWMLFFFSVIAIIVFMALLTHYYHQWGTERKSKSFMNDIYDHTLYTMTIIAGQGNHISAKANISLRLVAGVWCLTMVVLVNAYTGTLMSYLTVPKLRPIVNTLEELAASSETRMTVDFELGKARMFLEATSGPNKVIGNSLRNNPQLLIKGNTLDGVKNVLQRGATYFANHLLVNYFLAMDMKSHQECRMTYSDPIPFVEYYSLGLPKGGRHNSIINHDLQYLWENGLISHWMLQYTPNVDKCMVGKIKPSGKMTYLTLTDLSSAFALLGIGIGLSVFAFALERMAFTKSNRRNKIRRKEKMQFYGL